MEEEGDCGEYALQSPAQLNQEAFTTRQDKWDPQRRAHEDLSEEELQVQQTPASDTASLFSVSQ